LRFADGSNLPQFAVALLTTKSEARHERKMQLFQSAPVHARRVSARFFSGGNGADLKLLPRAAVPPFDLQMNARLL
jgi:hypothetical protein